MNDITVNKQNFTTFSDSDYNSTAYNDYRPTLVKFKHIKKKNIKGNVATGTGLIAKEVLNKFQQVYATDISQVMLSSASHSPNIQYLVSAAEDLSQFQDSTLDLMTSFETKWNFGYLGIFVPCCHGYPAATKKIKKLMLETLEDYWTPGNPEKYDYDEKEGKMSNGDSLLSKEWSVKRINGYMKTWSAYKNYMAK
ncbi:hypothetical protein C2G38_2206463 [Gigaspora rosea]|uniref:Methyltransferase type 11 domain-containing protein n=1 Tax=Gigaspora rosea TaxID=44941 RepID=A0A397UND7_9GLOM|nr:hypothetical protein C2G38_2206463 [Gigaspora rosea]